MFAFGALVAAGVPLLLGLSAVMAAIGLVALPSLIVPLGENTASIILLVGLAVGVDYTLFYLRREREERAAGRGHRDAIHIAAATSGRAVLISGLTVIVAMAGMFLAGDMTFTALGVGAITVVLVAMIGSVTVVPAILSVLGDKVEKGRIPFLGRRKGGESRMWNSMLDRVLRRPVVSVIAATAVLLVLAFPALGHARRALRHRRPAAQPRGDAGLRPDRRRVPGRPDPGVVTIGGQGRHHARDRRGDQGPGVTRGRHRPLQRPGRRDGVQGQAGGPDRDPDQGQRHRRRLERRARRPAPVTGGADRRPRRTASSRPT